MGYSTAALEMSNGSVVIWNWLLRYGMAEGQGPRGSPATRAGHRSVGVATQLLRTSSCGVCARWRGAFRLYEDCGSPEAHDGQQGARRAACSGSWRWRG